MVVAIRVGTDARLRAARRRADRTNVGLTGLDGLPGGLAVGNLVQDLDLGVRGEEGGEPLAKQTAAVGQRDPDGRGAGICMRVLRRTGRGGPWPHRGSAVDVERKGGVVRESANLGV